jgi:hypothetical protein
MKKYINPILSLGTAAALLGAIYFQNQQIEKLKVGEIEMISPETGDPIKVTNSDLIKMTNDYYKLSDSLHDELFNAKTEAGRYELTLEHLKEVNPKLGKQMEDWMAHETE